MRAAVDGLDLGGADGGGRGNTPGALFNAAFSNILGVVLTPILGSSPDAVHRPIRFVWTTAFANHPRSRLVPFAAGMWLHRHVRRWVNAHKPWVNRISNAVIIFIVYSAFCDSVEDRIWNRHWHLRHPRDPVAGRDPVRGHVLFWSTGLPTFPAESRGCHRGLFLLGQKDPGHGFHWPCLIFGNTVDLPFILCPRCSTTRFSCW